MIDQDEDARSAGEGSLDRTTQYCGDGFYDQDEGSGWIHVVHKMVTTGVKARLRLRLRLSRGSGWISSRIHGLGLGLGLG